MVSIQTVSEIRTQTIHIPGIKFRGKSSLPSKVEARELAKQLECSSWGSQIRSSEELPQGLAHLTSAQALEPTSDVCQNVVELANLRMAMEQIPDDKPAATTEHCRFPFGEQS